MSPFTFTSTCSRISARRDADRKCGNHGCDGRGEKSFNMCNSLESNILTSDFHRRTSASAPSSPSRRENIPPSARGSCCGFRRISSFVNPGRDFSSGRPGRPPSTFPSIGGLSKPALPLGAWDLRLGIGSSPSQRRSRSTFNETGGTRPRPARHGRPSPAGPGPSWRCGLNFMTTKRPSRSMVSTPRPSAMMRMRPYSARLSTESVGGAVSIAQSRRASSSSSFSVRAAATLR